MIRLTSLRAALIAAFAIVLLSACNRGGSDTEQHASKDDILRFVPANTPYLFASGTPLPDKVQDALEPKIDRILRAYQRVLREVSVSMLNDDEDEMSAEDSQRFAAVAEELTSLLSIEGLRNAGIDRDSGLALYGNGLLPVMRIEVSDAKLFDAAIARIEEAAGESMSVAELDGTSYRYLGDDKMSLVIAAFDGSAVFAVVPSGFDEDQTRLLLGLTLPKSSIADTSVLKDIASKYGYTDHYTGFIDSRRIAATFIDTPTGLDVPLLKLMEHEPDKLSAVCKAEIAAVVEVAPRMVFGYDEISLESISGSMVVEMRPDLAAGLSKLAASVPGLGRDPGGLLSVGFGINLLSLREFYEARLDAMEKDPFKCEYFEDLQAGVAKGREALNQPLPPVVYGLRGFMAIVDNVGDFDMANNQPPTEVDASVLVALEDAQAVVSMGAMFSPEFAGLNLQPDGVPVSLDLPQLKAMGQIVYAAMLEDAIAVSVGADAEARIKRVMAAEAVKAPPLFSMTMDAGRYYALIADAMMVDDDEKKDGMSLASREALRDATLAVGEMYDRMLFDVRFTSRGMEIDSKLTLKD